MVMVGRGRGERGGGRGGVRALSKYANTAALCLGLVHSHIGPCETFACAQGNEKGINEK